MPFWSFFFFGAKIEIRKIFSIVFVHPKITKLNICKFQLCFDLADSSWSTGWLYSCEKPPTKFHLASQWLQWFKKVARRLKAHEQFPTAIFGHDPEMTAPADTTTMEQHIKDVHENTRPHVCDICNKSYSLKNELRRHFKTSHGNMSLKKNKKI